MADVKELNINSTTYDIKAKSVVDQNSGSVKMWTGTKAQYDAIVTKDADTLYNITDDNTADAYEAYTKSEVDSMFAEVDLSNISSAGQKVIDGQWVQSFSTIYSNGAAPTTSNVVISISSYLPDDGYNYEVFVMGNGATGTTSGNQQSCLVLSDIAGDLILWSVITRTATSCIGGGSCILPVGTGRQITIEAFSNNTGTITLYLRGYRRIGTNS